jgi:hypothetical protein
MIDFGKIESKLNQDPAYRQAFLRDPVAALSREGISLPPEIQNSLRNQVRDAARRGGVKFRWALVIGPCA